MTDGAPGEATPRTIGTIDSVTGLRFVGAVAIMLTHSQYGPFFAPGTFAPFVFGGALPMFFVISGFVLALNARKYRTRSDFLVARFARLWPLHVVAIGLLVLTVVPFTTSVIQPPGDPIPLLLNLGMVQAWVPDSLVFWSYNAPSWSIAVETSLYLAFPVLLVFMARSARWRLPAMVLIVIGVLWVIATLRPDVDFRWLGHINPLVNIPTFSIGVLLGIAYLRVPAASTQRDGLPVRGTLIQLAAVAVVVVVNGFFGLWHGTPDTPLAVQNFLEVSGAVPAYALLIWALIRTDGAVSRLLSMRAIVWLGTISYGIYLFHATVMRWHIALLPDLDGVPVALQYFAIWAATIGIAGAAYYVVERPARHGIVAAWRRRSLVPPEWNARPRLATGADRTAAFLASQRPKMRVAAPWAVGLLVALVGSWIVLTSNQTGPVGGLPADMGAWRLKVLIASFAGGALAGFALLIPETLGALRSGGSSRLARLTPQIARAAIAGGVVGLVAIDIAFLALRLDPLAEVALKDTRASAYVVVAGLSFAAALVVGVVWRMVGRPTQPAAAEADEPVVELPAPDPAVQPS